MRLAVFTKLFIIAVFSCLYRTHTLEATTFRRDYHEEFSSYAEIQPMIYTASQERKDIPLHEKNQIINEDALILEFDAYGKKFLTDLRMKADLLPESYFEKYYQNGKPVIQHPMQLNKGKHCHYQGHIQGQNDSWAAISFCDGINGVVFDGKEAYFIKPDEASKSTSHLIFKASDAKSQNWICGTDDHKELSFSSQHSDKQHMHSHVDIPYVQRKSDEEPRFVELFFVADNEMFEKYGTVSRVTERCQEIINIVNAMYFPLNISVALVGVEVWNEQDKIQMSGDGDDVLNKFLQYRLKQVMPEHANDVAFLLCAPNFRSAIGKAHIHSICTSGHSGGIITDHSYSASIVASTAAHELGHLFGMDHDTNECNCPGRCYMRASLSIAFPLYWSSCSKEALNKSMARRMDNCLKNRPTLMKSMCGNGFLENDEECDCGPVQYCDNKCCDATSCKLAQNASCATGYCCDFETCQVKENSTKCREKTSECDLSEFCDGISEFCPEDIFIQNGKECGNGMAYCFEGKCSSHENHCKLLWGKTAQKGTSLCFSTNKRGSQYGNCGYNVLTGTYQACNGDDILCGRLHCIHSEGKGSSQVGNNNMNQMYFVSFITGSETINCHSIFVDLGPYDTDLGLSPNGAKCDTEKMCVNQKCVSVDSVKQNKAGTAK